MTATAAPARPRPWHIAPPRTPVPPMTAATLPVRSKSSIAPLTFRSALRPHARPLRSARSPGRSSRRPPSTARPLREVVGQLASHRGRLVLVHDAADDETGEPVRARAAPDVVADRDRAEGARVVVETDRVVQPGRLDDLVEIASHAVEAVVEPPRRPEPDGRVVAGQWRELAGVGRLVEREQDQGETRIVPEPFQERPEIACELRRNRDIGTQVGPKRSKSCRL